MNDLEELVKKAKISEKDKDAVLATVRKYSQLHYDKKENPVEEASKFWRKYYATYRDDALKKSPERRSLFVQALQKITNFSCKPYYIWEGRNLCMDFLGIGKLKKAEKRPRFAPLPTPAVSAWVNSLDHLALDWKGKDLGYGLGRYVRVSRDHLARYHPSHIHFLDLLARKGALYGLEDFMFDLAKGQRLGSDDAAEYFKTLQGVPLESREPIEKVRTKIPIRRRLNVDKAIYNLLALRGSTPSSRASVTTVLEAMEQNVDKGLGSLVIGSAQPLGEIITHDERVLGYGALQVAEIIRLSTMVKKPLTIPYLETLAYISQLKEVRPRDKSTCVDLSAELLKDYYRAKGDSHPIDEIQRKMCTAIDGFCSLDEGSRETALKLMRRSMERLKRSTRLDRDSHQLPIDILGRVIIDSVSVDQKNAEYFLNIVLGSQTNLGDENGCN